MTMILHDTTAMKLLHVAFLCCGLRAVHATGETVDIVVLSGTLSDLTSYQEGDNLTLRCEVTGLMASSSDYVVSWQHGVEVVARDTVLKAPYDTPRFAVELASLPGRGDSTKDIAYDLTISPVQRGDGGDFSCLIETQVPGDSMSFNIVAVQTVSLSVVYFPNQGSPTCLPDGPVDVTEGEALLLRCSSEKGNPEVKLTLSNIGTNPWSTIQDRDTVSKELLINNVTPSGDGLLFICTIESPIFPAFRRSCQLGPLTVIPRVVNPTLGVASPAPNNPILPPVSTRPDLPPIPSEACRGWLIAFLVSTGIATLSIVIIIALVTSRRMEEDREKMKRRKVKGLSLVEMPKEGAKVPDAEQGAYANVALSSE